MKPPRILNRRSFSWFVFLTSPLGLANGVLAGPITTNTALPVAEGELIVRGQTKLIRSTGDSTFMDRELTVWAAPTAFVYGATDKLALFGVFPYLDKDIDVTTPAGQISRGDSGLGDFSFLARYTLGQWDGPGEMLRLAPFVGLEVPTGDDDGADSFGRLPQALQLGSGSWDPLVGTVFTWQKLDWEFDVSTAYKFNSQANGFDFGDEARLDASFQYRLLPREIGSGVPGYLYGVLESNLIWQDNNNGFGGEDHNSGGVTWYLAPGLQYVTKRFILETAVQFPVVQNLNGSALENDFILTTGFRFNF